MNMKNEFLKRGSFVIGNGQATRFWEDTWLGDTPLASQYSLLYNVVRRIHVLVANLLANPSLQIEFRRNLVGTKWDAWLHLVQRVMTINLKNDEDRFVWKLNTSGSFTVKSMYVDFMNGYTIFLRKYIWKLKVPLKIKILMWFLVNKVILMKDKLA